MTALEFMEKQLRKCQHNLCRECKRDPASVEISNLLQECEHYEEAIEALKMVGGAENG